jgi:Ca2+-binding RTX toxin-like protein
VAVGAYNAAAVVDVVTNAGRIEGDVRLYDGADTYIGTGGTVIGSVSGGDGDDRFVPGLAADTFDGGNGRDLLDFSGQAQITLSLIVPSNNTGIAAGDSYTGFESVLATAGADIVDVDDLANIVTGAAGNDSLFGRGGDDILYGGSGNDSLVAGDGADFLGGFDGADRLTGGNQSDTLAGESGRDLLAGDAGTDYLYGGLDIDTLAGGTGADRIDAGGARDVATGGGGNDVFVFGVRTEAGDRIDDFSGAAGNNDSFTIGASGFGGGLAAGTLAASQFRARADNLAQDANDRFIFRTTDRTLWFDANGNAAGGLTLVADLQAGASVTAGDILLV